MKVINFEDIKELQINPLECFNWVSEMIIHKQEAILPPKAHLNLPGNVFCNVMPSIIQTEAGLWGGVKVVTRYPLRSPSLDSKLILINAETGKFLALMDANWITAMRTGAVAAHSIKLLAKKDFSSLGIIGLGNTARSTLLILSSIFPESDFTIRLLKYKNQAELFEERFRDYHNIHFVIEDNVETLISKSEVVVSCATYFSEDICPDKYFNKGILVVPVHTRGFTNCDLFFDKIYADDTAHVKDFKNFDKFHYFAEVSDVVNKKVPGRENSEERILAYNIGLSIHDVYFASQIYRIMAKNDVSFNRLLQIDMKEPDEKFWI